MWAARARAENDKGKRPRCRGSLGYLADGGAVPRPAQVLALEVADADALFAQAVEAGASVRQAVADVMFWGDGHGQLDEDPFGHRWNIKQHMRDVPRDEVVAAAAKLFG